MTYSGWYTIKLNQKLMDCIWRVSGEQGILQSSEVGHLHELGKKTLGTV